MLLPQVKLLLHLLLLPPASTTTAERSSSALWRLETWLRDSVGQVRLNAVAVCHVHKNRLIKVSVHALAEKVASKSDYRGMVFGKM